jgi:hypothetical protein
LNNGNRPTTKKRQTRRRTSASQKCFHPAEKKKNKTRAITFNEQIAVKAFDCLPDFA